MKTKLTVKQQVDVTLPNPIAATLPTAEDVEGARYLIDDAFPVPEAVTPYYYLRTPGDEDGTVLLAAGGSVDEGTDPDWFDDGPDADRSYGTGNRPVILFEESLYDCGAHPGDSFRIGDWPFTIIGEKTAIADRYISVEVFDEETNEYEDSAIKQRVDKWFADEILFWAK